MSFLSYLWNRIFIQLYSKGGGQRINSKGPKETEDRALATLPPTNCVDLAQLGNQISGFYIVIGDQKTATVYCDFSLASNDPSNQFK